MAVIWSEGNLFSMIWSEAQWLERATRIRKILGSIPGGAALCFFRLIRLSVLLSLSELKEKSLIWNNFFFLVIWSEGNLFFTDLIWVELIFQLSV